MGQIERRVFTITSGLVLESNAPTRGCISVQIITSACSPFFGWISPASSSTHIETNMHHSVTTGQVAQPEGPLLRGIDEAAPKERRLCGKPGICGSPDPIQTSRCSAGWSLAKEEDAPQLPPSPEGALPKIGYHHIRSLGGRGKTVRKVEKDGVYPQPLFVEYVDKNGGRGELEDLLTDEPGVSRCGITVQGDKLINIHQQWAVSGTGKDGEIDLKLLGGSPCVVTLDDGREFIGLDDFGQYNSPELQWKLAEASGDFEYQTSSGEALKVYRYADSAILPSATLNEGAFRIVNAAQPTHGWIYKQYEGADMVSPKYQ